jgi:hypothetical protein
VGSTQISKDFTDVRVLKQHPLGVCQKVVQKELTFRENDKLQQM